jgi:hypothetical protein
MKVKRGWEASSSEFNLNKKSKMKVEISKAGIDFFFGEFFPVWVWVRLYRGKVGVSLNKINLYKAENYYDLLWRFLKENKNNQTK